MSVVFKLRGFLGGLMKLRFPVEKAESDFQPGKWRPFGVGIDVHKDMVWVCVLRADYVHNKQERRVVKFETTAEGLNKMRLWLEEIVPLNDRHYLVEATSTFQFMVIRALAGWIVTVINPRLVGSAKRKTDRWDAQKLAHHDMVATFPSHILPTLDEYALRCCLRRYVKIGRAISRNVNALRSRLCIFGVKWYGNIESEVGWRRLGALAVGAPPDAGQLLPDERVELAAMAEAARRVPEFVRSLNQWQLREVDALREQRNAVRLLAVRACDPRTLQLLCTVPHINEQSALCFAAEVGFRPLRRFSSLRSIVAYAGFDPSKRVSADQVTSHVPTAGSRHIRRCFLQAAAGALLAHSSGLATYGRAVAARYGRRGWFAGVNAIGRRLIRYCASVLINNTPFTEGLCHGGETEAKRLLTRVHRAAHAVDEGFGFAVGGQSPGPPEDDRYQSEEWALGDLPLGSEGYRWAGSDSNLE